MNQRQNNCLIDYLRVSIPNTNLEKVIANVLYIDYLEFSSQGKGSPYPTYDNSIGFANIKLHSSKNHDSVLIDLSGQACRQYEEYMSRVDGWHWYNLINTLVEIDANITRIDLALDIFDNSCPSVKVIQDYIKRGQLSSKSQKFMEIIVVEF